MAAGLSESRSLLPWGAALLFDPQTELGMSLQEETGSCFLHTSSGKKMRRQLC